jgi:hypothetical protein
VLFGFRHTHTFWHSLLNSWVSLRHFAVNLTGQPKMYWCSCCTGVNKWYEIACICHQTQGQHIQWTINSLWWLCLDLELTPRQIYDVIWNPRIVNSDANCTFHPCLYGTIKCKYTLIIPLCLSTVVTMDELHETATATQFLSVALNLLFSVYLCVLSGNIE